MEKSELELVFPPEAIAERVQAVARDIEAVYGQDPLLVVCVLKGAYAFFADLCRALRNPLIELDFVRIASYGHGTASSGKPVFSKDMELSAQDRHVLIVEDIVDSGHTMELLLGEFRRRNPASLALATLLDKKERRVRDVHVDFRCFEVPDGFFVGYGLDYDEKYRSLPGIYTLSLPGQA